MLVDYEQNMKSNLSIAEGKPGKGLIPNFPAESNLALP